MCTYAFSSSPNAACASALLSFILCSLCVCCVVPCAPHTTKPTPRHSVNAILKHYHDQCARCVCKYAVLLFRRRGEVSSVQVVCSGVCFLSLLSYNIIVALENIISCCVVPGICAHGSPPHRTQHTTYLPTYIHTYIYRANRNVIYVFSGLVAGGWLSVALLLWLALLWLAVCVRAVWLLFLLFGRAAVRLWCVSVATIV